MYLRAVVFIVLSFSVFLSFSQQLCLICPPDGGGGGGFTSISLSGPSTVELNGTYTYTVSSSGGTPMRPSYQVSGGQIISSNSSSVNVKWTSLGSSRWVKVTANINGNIYTDTKYVTVVTYTPTATEETQKNTTSFQANWNEVSGAAGYYLYVATNSSFTSYVSGYNGKLIEGDGGLQGPGGGAYIPNFYSVTGLTPGRYYYYRVRTKKPNGSMSGYSNTITANTTLSTPSVVNPSNKSTDRFTAKWNSVSGATSYKLYVSTASNFSSHVSGYSGKTVSGASHVVTGLSPGKRYYYRLKAVAPAYTSGYSSSKASNTTLSTPSVSNPTSKQTDRFTANWGSVSGATSYKLYVSTTSNFSSHVSGYAGKTNSGTSHVVTGLSPGKRYYYRVKAVSSVYTTGYSSSKASNTTLSTPSIGNPTSKKTDRFTANWGSVSGATSYKLYVSTSSSYSSYVSGYAGKTVTGTSHTVTGLSPGKRYYYRVKAVSSVYTTGYSSSKASNTILSTPSIGNPTSKQTDRFTANWGSVSGATSYKLYVSTTSNYSSYVSGYAGKTISGTSHTITGLSPGKHYYYRVKAVSSVYTTGYSSSKTSNTTMSTPSIGNPTSKKTDRFTANWGSVSGATSYKLYVSTSSSYSSYVSGYAGKTISGTSHTVTGLSPGKRYYYRVKAVSSAYTTGYSGSKASNTTLSTPSIGNPTSKQTDRFTANWGNVSGATSYKLYVSTTSNYSNYVSGYAGKTISGTSHTVTGLSPGTHYYYRVKAVSSVYTTGYSSSKSSNTILSTPSIGNPTSKQNDRFTANWGSVSGATSYKLYVSTSSSFSSHVSGYSGKTISGTSHTITGLSPGTNYYYRVKAVSSPYTTGYSSYKASNTTMSTPTVANPTSKQTDRFTANWGSVTGATRYLLYVSTNSSFSSHLSGYSGKTINGTNYTITGLNPGTHYYYRVKASSPAYTTSYSSSKTANTTLSTPVIANASSLQTNQFTANWMGVTGATSYKLYVSTNSSFSSHVSGYNGKSVTGSSHTVTGLAPGTNYYYRVKAVSTPYITGYSSSKATNTTLSIPSVSNPTSKQTDRFTANWTSVSGATSYLLYVSTNSAFSSHVSGFNGKSVSGTNYTVTGLTPGKKYYYRVKAVSSAYTTAYSGFKESNTTLSAPVASEESNKAQTSFTANWSSVSGANTYRIQVSTSSSFSSIFNDQTVSGTSASVTGISYGTTYYYRVRATSSSSINSAYSSTITVHPLVLPGSISYSEDVCPGSSPGQINGTTPSGGTGTYEYQWQYYNGSWQTLATNTSNNYDPTINISSATKFRRRVRSGDSGWKTSPELTIQTTAPISDVGTLATSITNDVCPGETVSLSFTKGDSRLDMNTAKLVVVRDGQEVDLGALTNAGATYTATAETYYQDQFKLKGAQLCTGSPIYSNVVTFNYSCNTPPSPNENFVRTEVPMVPVQTDEELSILDATKMSTTYAYFDGLGRSKQSVNLKASPSGKDVIQVVEYDEFGRRSIQRLPFTDVNNGAFHTDAVTAQISFFINADKVAHDSRPFSETEFEASPLSRVLATIPQGQDWYDNNRTVTNNYTFNTAGEAKKWAISNDLPVSTATYLANQLNVVEVTAEDGQVTKTYTNGIGQTVLKRVKANETPVVWYDTYYIYDDFGNLRFVIPPKLAALTDAPNLTQVRALAFEYHYDGRKRMVKKYVPGAEGVHMVYDQWDRLVMTQDGNQRNESPKEWLYTKYDQLNRPIMTGIMTDNRDRATIQGELDTYPTRYESSASNEVGYSLNNAYPTSAQITDVLTVTFYDDYDFMDADWADLVFAAQSGFDLTFNDQVKGQVTGSMTRAIGQDWIRTTSYYDDKYRPIQSVSNNHLGGIDRSSNAYDFIGNVVKTLQDHSSSYESVAVLKEFEYDHANRLLREYNTIDNEARVLVTENQYNELGELIEKNLHSPLQGGQGGVSFLQSTDYRYNIRGWLTDINNHKLQNDGGTTNDDTNDLFGMRLFYNQDQYTANGEVLEKQYGGNIAGVKWSSNNLVDTPTEQAYVYHYDKVSRLTKATYGTFNTDTNFTGQAFYSMNASYDENGNILTLNRRGKLNDTLIDMDLLAYEYEDGNQSNRLYRVDDTGDDAEGYKEIGGIPGELYYYDANGNMIADVNKEIVRIEYNHLNLPIEVEFLDGKLITYEYDAAGIKLRQTVDDGINTPKVTDYLGLGVYEDQELSFLFTSEGRAIKYANSYGYEYFLKDHLGNTRVAFGDLPEREEYKATMETERSGYEESYFEFPTNTRVNTENRTPLGNESVALNGVVAGRQVGPAKVLNITAGDKIELEVWTKYTFSSWNNTSVADIASVISGAFGGASAGTGGESASGSLNNALSNPVANGLFADADSGEPRAYLQYLFFDEAHAFQQSHSGFIAVGAEAEGAFAKLETVVDGFTEDGFLFVYIVNESNQDAEVYFDDLKIIQESAATSLVVNSSQDYYPFGLTFNSYQRTASVEQKYLYNGKELDENTGWHDYGARMYMADLGRWNHIDPAGEEYYPTSPYVYALNTPINAIDPDGKRVYFVAGAGNDQIGWNYIDKFQRAFDTGGIQGFTRINASNGTYNDIAFTAMYRSNGYNAGYEAQGVLKLRENPMIDMAAEEIRADLKENPLEDGEQFNLAGYSYGSVLQAHAALKLANEGQYIDNLILIGSPISSDSRLYRQLQKNKNIGKVLRIDIEGDKLSDPSSILEFIQGGQQNADPDNTGEGPHFDLARPGTGEGDQNDTYQRIKSVVVEWLKQQGVE